MFVPRSHRPAWLAALTALALGVVPACLASGALADTDGPAAATSVVAADTSATDPAPVTTTTTTTGDSGSGDTLTTTTTADTGSATTAPTTTTSDAVTTSTAATTTTTATARTAQSGTTASPTTTSSAPRVRAAATGDTPAASDDSLDVRSGVATALDVLANDPGVDPDTAVLAVSQDPAHGKATVKDGKVEYTSTGGYKGLDAFDYTVTVGSTRLSAHVSLSVLPAFWFVAVDDVATTVPGAEIDIPVLNNDLTASYAGLDFAGRSEHGTLARGYFKPLEQTAIAYTPDAGFTGTDHFTYTLSDGNGQQDTATVTVAVQGPADAVPDYERLVVGGNDRIDVLANDHNTAGLYTVVLRQPADGSVTVNDDGSLQYDGVGTEEQVIVYGLAGKSDGSDLRDSTDVIVNPVATAPGDGDVSATEDNFTFASGDPIVMDVLANDLGAAALVRDHAVSLRIWAGEGVCGADDCRFEVDGNHRIVWTNPPKPTETTTYDVDYTVYRDEVYGISGSAAHVTITPDLSMGRPVAVDDVAIVHENLSTTIDVLANDLNTGNRDLYLETDELSDASAYVWNHMIAFTAYPGTTGRIVTLKYKLMPHSSGGYDQSVPEATVTVLIDGPIVNDDTAVTDPGTPVSFDVTANDSGTDELAFDTLSLPTHGTLETDDSAPGHYTYTPAPGFSGVDTFTYGWATSPGSEELALALVPATTGTGSESDTIEGSATVRITVRPPTLESVTLNTLTGSSVWVDLSAYEHHGDGFTVTVDDPSHGTVSLDGTWLEYVPADTFVSGKDVFGFHLVNTAGTVVANGDITVVVDPLQAVDDDTVSGPVPSGGSPTTVSVPVMANDNAPDGFGVEVVSDPAHGTAVANEDGTISYTPDGTFGSAGDSFTYRLVRNANETTVASLPATVHVHDLDAVDDVQVSVRGRSVSVPVLANDVVFGTPSVQLVSGSVHGGTASVQSDQTVLFQPDPSAPATSTGGFQYALVLDGRQVDVATATIAITRPDAVDDTATTRQGEQVTVPVLENDVNVSGLSLALVTGPAHGTASIAGSSLRYRPAAAFFGSDSLVYGLVADGITYDTATVRITVTRVVVTTTTTTTTPAARTTTTSPSAAETTTSTTAPTVRRTTTRPPVTTTTTTTTAAVLPLPIAVDDAATTTAGVGVRIRVLANDRDPGGTFVPGSVHVISDPVNGTATVTGDGTVIYVPDPATTATSDTFRYRVTDSRGVAAMATVRVRIAPAGSLQLDSPSSAPDTKVTLHGRGCHRGDRVTISVDGTIAVTVDAVGDGSFSASLVAPGAIGRHSVRAVCASSSLKSALDVVTTTSGGGGDAGPLAAGMLAAVGGVLAFYLLTAFLLAPDGRRRPRGGSSRH